MSRITIIRIKRIISKVVIKTTATIVIVIEFITEIVAVIITETIAVAATETIIGIFIKEIRLITKLS